MNTVYSVYSEYYTKMKQYIYMIEIISRAMSQVLTSHIGQSTNDPMYDAIHRHTVV